MKKHYILVLILVLFCVGKNSLLKAQDNVTVPQVIIGNGGRFETTPPFFDYVTMESYNTSTQTYTLFDTIYTQSIQDILVSDHYAYVAAQDSLVKYDLDTWQRVAAVADSGLSKLAIYNDKLIVTKQYPVSRFFVEVLNSSDLSIFSLIDNISGECGGAVAAND